MEVKHLAGRGTVMTVFERRFKVKGPLKGSAQTPDKAEHQLLE
ncbi:MAG: hypothetical protein WAK17_11730 [Candidatus Nitrosopolaris sp.]